MSNAILEFSGSISRTLVIFCFSAILLLILTPISVAQADAGYSCSVREIICKEPIRTPSQCSEETSFLARLFRTPSVEFCEKREEVQYRYEQENYRSCVADQKSQETRCEILTRQREIDIESKKIREDASPQENGSICAQPSECKSGYCLPGPDVRVGGSAEKYCVAEQMNCAWPGEQGYKYDKPLEWGQNNIVLTCNDPGKGRWAQFYKIN